MTVAPPPAGRPRRGLLIDYGGVLTTSVFDSFAAFEHAEGLAPRTVARLLRDDPRATALLVDLETGGPEPVFESGLAALLDVPSPRLISRLLGAVRPDAAMLEALRAARRAGVRTALVSNSWGRGSYPRDLFAELFDATVISGSAGLRKPDPGIYRLAADRVGLDPDECVFVDDLPANLAPAARLGMEVVHHTDAAQTAGALARLFALESGTPGAGPAHGR